MSLITRSQYLNAPTALGMTPAEAHRAYYAQFVGPGTVNLIVMQIGADRLMASTDPHFNDIPLDRWDRNHLLGRLPLARRLEDAGDYPTTAGLLSIAKEAARQFVES